MITWLFSHLLWIRSTLGVNGFFTIIKVRIGFICFSNFCWLSSLGSTCQQVKKARRHYYLLQELAHSGSQTFYFSRLSGDIFDFVFKFIRSLKYYYRLSRISIALSFARIFPAFHKARQSAYFLAVICFLSYLSCVLILTFECPSEDAPWYETVALHCHKTGATFLVRDLGSACELSPLPISTYSDHYQWIFLWTAFLYYSP